MVFAYVAPNSLNACVGLGHWGGLSCIRGIWEIRVGGAEQTSSPTEPKQEPGSAMAGPQTAGGTCAGQASILEGSVSWENGDQVHLGSKYTSTHVML